MPQRQATLSRKLFLLAALVLAFTLSCLGGGGGGGSKFDEARFDQDTFE